MELKKTLKEFRCSFVYYLGGNLKRKVLAFQKESYKLTGSKASFDLWRPHITVAPPIWLTTKDLDDVYNRVKSAISKIKPIEVKINGFGFSSRGDYSCVVSLLLEKNKNLEKLTQCLVKSLSKNYRHDYFWPSSYNYHITISYKDLTTAGFAQAEMRFKSRVFKKTAFIDHVAIAKEEKTGKTSEVKRLNL